MKIKILLIIIVLFSLISPKGVKAQCCDTAAVTTFIVDLSSTPDSVWISPDVGRDGQCCGASASENCIQFIIYTHPSVTEAAFGVASPPDPPGQWYSIACGDSAHMGQPICIQGGDTICIIYCKGGNDQSEYQITVSNTIDASPDVGVSDGCTAEIWATGFDGYVEWNSIAPGTYGQYNSYLDCQTCAITGVTPTAGFPPFIDYMVQGDVYSPCTMTDLTDTVRVYFYDEKGVDIVPDNPTICFGGSDTVLTAMPYGGVPPYSYLWSTGETTPSITVAGGTYWVEVTDTTGCPPVYDTVTVLEFSLPILADAGPDFSVCLSETAIDINGTVQIAQGGTWTGGSNSFTPSADSLSTTYNPTLAEIVTGNVIELILTTTGNYGCPPDTDTLNITYLPDLTVSAGGDQLVCEDVTTVDLNGTISDGILYGLWTTIDGTGSFSPNDSALTTQYLPTAQDTANGFVTIVFTSNGMYDCEPKSDTAIVTFGDNPTPDFSFVDACLYDNITFVDNTTNAITWDWDFGNGNTDNTSTPPVQTYGTAGDYIVSLTVEDGMGCVGVKIDTVTIYPVPNADFTVGNICVQEQIPFTDISTVTNDVITSWQWDFGNGNTSTDQNPTTTYASSGNFPVQLIVSSTYCYDTITQFVDVHPLPVLDVTSSMTQGCNHAVVDFTNNTTGAISYQWTFGDGITTTEISPMHTFTNESDTDMVFMVELIAYTANSCSDTLITPITIHPTPSPQLSSDALPGCSPLEVVFTNNSTGASTYSWNFGDGNTSTLAEPSYTFINTSPFIEYYNVVLTATSIYGCIDSVNQYITVFPNPSSYINVDPDSSCSPTEVLLTTAAGQYSYEWFYGDGTSELADAAAWHTYYNFGDVDSVYQVELITTTSLGCEDTVSNTVVIHPTPIANFTIDTVSGCSPLTVQITNTSTGASNHIWDFGDGNIQVNNNPTFTYTYTNNLGVNQSFVIELSAQNTNNCENVISKSVTVYSSPVVAFTQDITIGCSPLNVTFDNQTIGGNLYDWDFADGNISTNTHPTNTFVNSGTVDTVYNVELISTSVFGCKDTADFNITVHPQPEALFALQNSAGCSPYMSDITNNSSGAIAYQWDFGDGQTSTVNDLNILHEYINDSIVPADYQIELVAENSFGCYDTVIQTLVVYPSVHAIFDVDTAGCAPLDLSFSNVSTGAVIYEWDFGDGSSSNNVNPSHVYNNLDEINTIVYTATLKATSYYSCIDSMQKDITVYPVPKAIFAVNEIVGCSPFTAVIENSSLGAQTYDWDYGDGTSGAISLAQHNHIFENISTSTTTFNIELHVQNTYGCNDTSSQVVTVYPNTTADFYSDTLGCSPLDLDFVNTSDGVDTYYWTFGDGATSGEFHTSHTFINNQSNSVSYTVLLAVESEFGCTDSISRTIEVLGRPTALFEATPTYQLYPSTTVQISNQTEGNWSYLWEFGDGEASNNENPVNHTYDTWGEYTIQLKASSVYCSDSITHTILIAAPPPVAAFEPEAEGCAPLTVTFQNNSLYGENYLWNLGDGTSSNQENPTNTYYEPGIYVVTLRVSGSGGEALAPERIITVHPDPIADFKAVPSIVTIPDEEVHFINLTENGDQYIWYLGDGTTSIEEEPIHLYNTVGFFDIIMYAESEYGCRDTSEIKTIETVSDCDMIFPNAMAPMTAHLQENRYFKPLYKGVIDYRLEIFDQWGELIFISRELDVGWDGMYRGEMCKLDVYVWKATWTCISGKEYKRTGDVTLIK